MPKLVTADLTLAELTATRHRRRGVRLVNAGATIASVNVRRTRGTVYFEDNDVPLDLALTDTLTVEWEEPTEEETKAQQLEYTMRWIRNKVKFWQQEWATRQEKIRTALEADVPAAHFDSFMLASIVEKSRRDIMARQVLEVLDREDLDDAARLDLIRRMAISRMQLGWVPNSSNNQAVELELHERAAWGTLLESVGLGL